MYKHNTLVRVLTPKGAQRTVILIYKEAIIQVGACRLVKDKSIDWQMLVLGDECLELEFQQQQFEQQQQEQQQLRASFCGTS